MQVLPAENGSINGVPLEPDYSFVFTFEKSVDYETVQAWWRENWTHSVYWSTAYLFAIFFGQVSLFLVLNFRGHYPVFSFPKKETDGQERGV